MVVIEITNLFANLIFVIFEQLCIHFLKNKMYKITLSNIIYAASDPKLHEKNMDRLIIVLTIVGFVSAAGQFAVPTPPTNFVNPIILMRECANKTGLNQSQIVNMAQGIMEGQNVTITENFKVTFLMKKITAHNNLNILYFFLLSAS